MEYPYFKKQFSLVPYQDKLSIGSTPGIALEIEDPNQLVYKILIYCDGESTVEQIAEKIEKEYPEVTYSDVNDVINTVSSYPYIMEDHKLQRSSNLSNVQIERHSRNMNFLSNFDPDGTTKYDKMEAIINSKVLVIGLGGVGSSVILNLAALGVSKIVGVDFDKVDLSNLNRQLLYDEADVGSYKADSSKRRINQFNSEVDFETLNQKIESSRDVKELIVKYDIDFIFCAADQPSIWIYKWINQACIETLTPWIYGGNSEATSYFQTILPGETSCFQCREDNLIESSKEGTDKYFSVLNNGYATQNNCLAATSGCLTAFMIFDFIRVIADFDKPRGINKLFTIDYRDYTISHIEQEFNQHCSCHLVKQTI
ncbi:HesA/MoeB/ThiF family protein [Alkalibacterium olivapovliticus]|uniref:Molybdopterin/thiamine biosynthesis adenylyltransferase n=1 Tax=Alkalibacterium olivapovliticus TaxID=99907 RepID=A0A2T0VTL9_9LACT|nr:ThiF family adenylyltransferase [Alkalibacterium olivapovliticus]PRY74223.1 molybdopterin/thiamine biosynthesis adenylyltransferase [Alkalibacterium olivapovliticus]